MLRDADEWKNDYTFFTAVQYDIDRYIAYKSDFIEYIYEKFA